MNHLKQYYPLLGLISLFGFLSCSHSGQDAPESNLTSIAHEEAAVSVATVEAVRRPMDIIFHAGGTTEAEKQQQLFFGSAGLMASVPLRQGHLAQQGELLFDLAKDELQAQLVGSQLATDKALIAYEEALLAFGAGGRADDERGTRIRNNLRLTSGLAQAELKLAEARQALSLSEIRAPFRGILANISTKKGDYIAPNTPVALIYDPTTIVVRFRLPEAVAFTIRKGITVQVRPVFLDSLLLKARVLEINPVVDKHGTIELLAGPFNHSALLPGMNMQVEVMAPLAPALVVPREAVVYRSGKAVVFTYKAGKAQWNYIKLGRENGKEVQVTEGLKEGDVVIVTQVILLDHESPVTIEEKGTNITQAAE